MIVDEVKELLNYSKVEMLLFQETISENDIS